MKLLNSLLRLAVYSGVGTKSKMITYLTQNDGATALHYAVRRGDLEIVEMLMQYGAKASVRDNLGRDVLSCCDSFPEIKGAIQRVQREGNLHGNPTHT